MFIYGILPKPAALLTAFISGASAFGVLWFVEPISYFPVVGAALILSGSIANTEVPRIAPIVRTDTLITIDTAIPRVATTDPFSVPGLEH